MGSILDENLGQISDVRSKKSKESPPPPNVKWKATVGDGKWEMSSQDGTQR